MVISDHMCLSIFRSLKYVSIHFSTDINIYRSLNSFSSLYISSGVGRPNGYI